MILKDFKGFLRNFRDFKLYEGNSRNYKGFWRILRNFKKSDLCLFCLFKRRQKILINDANVSSMVGHPPGRDMVNLFFFSISVQRFWLMMILLKKSNSISNMLQRNLLEAILLSRFKSNIISYVEKQNFCWNISITMNSLMRYPNV